jgi:hypothetical protein
MVSSPSYQLTDEQWEEIKDFFPANVGLVRWRALAQPA